MTRPPAWFAEAVRFGVVGGLGFVADAGSLALMMSHGASPYGGRVFSIALAIVVTWWLNRRLTFRTRMPPTWREFRTYAFLALAGAAINYVIYSGVLWAGGGVYPGIVLGTAVAAVFNFVRYRKLLGTA